MKTAAKILALVFFLSFVPALHAQNNAYGFMGEITRGYQDFLGAMVVQPNCFLYAQPDTTAGVLEKLEFETPVEVLETGTDEKQKIHWYRVKTKEQTGYVRMEDLATQSLYSPQTKTRYFVLLPSPFAVSDSMRITSFDTDKNVFTDTIWENDISAESYLSLHLQPGNLKGVKNIICLRKIMPYCGGGTGDTYFADTGKELVHLFSTFSGGDIGFIHTDLAWLPVKTPNGQTEMFLIGDALPASTPNVFPRDWKTSIPKQELVVVQSVETEYELDENEMPVKHEDGTEIETVVSDVVKYYRWKGDQLVIVKTMVIQG